MQLLKKGKRTMQIGMIGAGRVAQSVARYLLPAGHTVLLSNSRGPKSLSELVMELGPGATAGTVEEAAQAPIVLLAVPWAAVPKALSGLPAWEGRILIDATDQFVIQGSQLVVADLGGRGSSEIVAELTPGARVVKAINAVYIKNFAAGPRLGEVRRVIFLSGDDESAKREVGALISELGFAVVDLGELQTGGRMQQAGAPLAGLDLFLHD
jgi:8-hydroxy-5-deazaflavin:NADPH oxidoreductase